MTPLRAVASGMVAGAVGTLAMDTFLYSRYRRGGGASRFRDWELSTGLSSWDDAPAPAQVGRRLFEGLFRIEIPARHAALVSNVMHWGYGMLNGVEYAIVAGSLRRPHIAYGLPFGATVWVGDYIILPAAKLYEPIWKYDLETLGKDLTAHLVFGLGTATAFQVVAGRS
ncbi:MAG TPA: hypothetical protein VI318_01535 [Baekduia sp.]